MALLCYARASTRDEDLASQQKALHEGRLHPRVSETISGIKNARPQLTRLMKSIEYGDIVSSSPASTGWRDQRFICCVLSIRSQKPVRSSARWPTVVRYHAATRQADLDGIGRAGLVRAQLDHVAHPGGHPPSARAWRRVWPQTKAHPRQPQPIAER
jgi:hypothetical protein